MINQWWGLICSFKISSIDLRIDKRSEKSILVNLHNCERSSLVDDKLFRKLVRPRMAVAIQEAAMEDGGNMENRKSVNNQRKEKKRWETIEMTKELLA